MSAENGTNGHGTRARLSITKAYKMYVGGAFVRSESGRYFQVSAKSSRPDSGSGSDGFSSGDTDTVNIPLGSRKDARDAVLAAKNAFDGWSARAAMNRGQILYRLAEVMESRRNELVDSLRRGGVATAKDAEAEVDASIDRAVFYAGFCDKFTALLASYNPVAGPHFDFSVPDPMGVVAIVPPARPTLLGLVSTILPVVGAGNTCVAIASSEDPRTAVVFCECLATSDFPGGVVNVLTGEADEIAPHLAKHREVNGLEIWTKSIELQKKLEADGADSVKRVKSHAPLSNEAWHDARVGQGIGWMERFLETKTIWHPVGV